MIDVFVDNASGTLRFTLRERREGWPPERDGDLIRVATFWRAGRRKLFDLAATGAPRSCPRWEKKGRTEVWFLNTEELRAALRDWSGSFNAGGEIVLGFSSHHEIRRATLPSG